MRYAQGLLVYTTTYICIENNIHSACILCIYTPHTRTHYLAYTLVVMCSAFSQTSCIQRASYEHKRREHDATLICRGVVCGWWMRENTTATRALGNESKRLGNESIAERLENAREKGAYASRRGSIKQPSTPTLPRSQHTQIHTETPPPTRKTPFPFRMMVRVCKRMALSEIFEARASFCAIRIFVVFARQNLMLMFHHDDNCFQLYGYYRCY